MNSSQLAMDASSLAQKIYDYYGSNESEREKSRTVGNLGLPEGTVNKLHTIIHKLDNFVYYILVAITPKYREEALTEERLKERAIPIIQQNILANSGIIPDYATKVRRLCELNPQDPQQRTEFYLTIGPFVGVTETFEQDFPKLSQEAQMGI